METPVAYPPTIPSASSPISYHFQSIEEEQIQHLFQQLILLHFCNAQQILLSSLSDQQQKDILQQYNVQQVEATRHVQDHHLKVDISNINDLIIQYGLNWELLASLVSSDTTNTSKFEISNLQDAFIEQATIQIQNWKLIQDKLQLNQQPMIVTPYISPYMNAQEHLLDVFENTTEEKQYSLKTPQTPTVETDDVYDYKPTEGNRDEMLQKKVDAAVAQNMMTFFSQQQEALEWELRRETRTKYFIIRVTVCMLITVSYFCFCFMTCFFVLCLYLLFRK